jgi:hypothetical protein
MTKLAVNRRATSKRTSRFILLLNGSPKGI